MERIDVRMSLSQAYVQKHDLESAAQELEHLIQMAPTNKAARLKLVDVYSQLSPPRWNDAEKLLDEGGDQSGTRGETRIGRAPRPRSISETGETDKAVESIKKAISLAKDEKTTAALDAGLPGHSKRRQEKRRAYCQPRDTLANDSKTARAAVGLTRCGIAQAIALGNKQEALTDFDTAFGLASETNDIDEMAQIVQTIADQMGLDKAIRRIQQNINLTATTTGGSLPRTCS